MIRISAITFFATAVLITLGSAQAQEVQAKVPFDFIVRKQVLPAGTYRIFRDPGPNNKDIIRIQNNKDKNITEFSMTSANENRSANNSELIFTHYGGRYFLHEVLCPGVSITLEIPVTKLEKRSRVREREALIQNSGQVVAALK